MTENPTEDWRINDKGERSEIPIGLTFELSFIGVLKGTGIVS